MNRLPSEATAWTRELLARLERSSACAGELALIVPFTHLSALTQLTFGSGVAIGAQDVSAHESGAYTGEVAAAMLADLGVRYVVVGHSERRSYHGESDAVVNAKTRRALEHGLVPIVCVGEKQAERDAGDAERVVLGQVRDGLEGIAVGAPDSLVVAYEPVWAIGTGKVATAEQAQEVHAALRAWLVTHVGAEVAAAVRIIYGGSVTVRWSGCLLCVGDTRAAAFTAISPTHTCRLPTRRASLARRTLMASWWAAPP